MIPARPRNSARLRALFSGRDHDARLQHTLEQMPEAAFFVAPRTGTFIAINGRAAALTGWSREELLSRSLAEVIAAPAAETALAHIHELRPGQTRQLMDVALRTRSGRIAEVDLRLSALEAPGNGEPMVLVLATHSAERLLAAQRTAQAAQALDCVEQLLKLLSEPTEESLDIAVRFVRDMLAADGAGLYHVTPDHPALRLRASTAAARSFPQALGPGEAQYVRSPFQWSVTQRPQGYLQQAARSNGWGNLLSHPIGAGPGLVGAVCVAYEPGQVPPADAPRLLAIAALLVHQLTTQINSRAAYSRSRDLALRMNSRLAAINAQIEEGVLSLTASATLDEINNAASQMFGYRSEEVTGLPFDDVLIGEPGLSGLVRRCLEHAGQPDPQGAEGPLACECRLLRRSGEPFPASVRLRPLPEGGCIVTVRDLSEVAASAVQREHLDQLAFVGQASQAFAHEVRGPLNNIKLGVQFLAARLPSDEELVEKCGRIQAECARLSSLMTDMLAWAKPINPRLEPLDLSDLFRRLLHRFSTKIEQRNVRLNYSVEPNCPLALADARMIEQVFVNLVDNALQAMPAGGTLSVTIGSGSRGSPGSVVEASIVDSGPGISDEHRRRVFDPYFTTKPDGTGLGLAICKRLVTVQHGAIGVDSYPGSGTVFKVTLPVFVANPGETDQP